MPGAIGARLWWAFGGHLVARGAILASARGNAETLAVLVDRVDLKVKECCFGGPRGSVERAEVAQQIGDVDRWGQFALGEVIAGE